MEAAFVAVLSFRLRPVAPAAVSAGLPLEPAAEAL